MWYGYFNLCLMCECIVLVGVGFLCVIKVCVGGWLNFLSYCRILLVLVCVDRLFSDVILVWMGMFLLWMCIVVVFCRMVVLCVLLVW